MSSLNSMAIFVVYGMAQSSPLENYNVEIIKSFRQFQMLFSC